MKKIISIILAGCLVFALAGCSSNSDSQSEDTNKKLTLATSADFPPYESIDDDGNYVGIDIEVATAVAEKLGMELEVVNMDFNSIVSSVASGKYDIGMAGLTVTEDRLESVDFTDPYANGVQVIIVPENSPITSVDDLYAEGADYTVGVQLTTTGDTYFSRDIADGLTTCSISQFKVATDAILALTTGKVDCVIIDNEPAKKFVMQYVLSDIEKKQLFYDGKTILQEIVQQTSHEKTSIEYPILKEEGPDHNKCFVVRCTINGKEYASGSGRTKKKAEQQAAYETILMLRQEKE